MWETDNELADTVVDFGENIANSQYFNMSVYTKNEINTASAELHSLPLSLVQ